MIEIQQYGSLVDGDFVPRREDVFHEQKRQAGNVHDCVLTITGKDKRTVDQNSYAHAICSQMALRLNQDSGDGITGYNVYKRIEKMHCTEHKYNPLTGELEEFIDPLKDKDKDVFWQIMEETRINFMQNYPDCHISTPAEHYGLTEQAYDLMKQGVINYVEAKKMSEDKMLRKIEETFS